MDRSHYIAHVPTGEFEVLSSGPLSPEVKGGQLSGFYSSIVDLLSGNRRGQAFTWALNGVDLSTNPSALQAAYDADPDPINHYLEYVDIDKILQKITEPGQEKKYGLTWWRSRVPAFLIGAGIGAASIAILKKS